MAQASTSPSTVVTRLAIVVAVLFCGSLPTLCEGFAGSRAFRIQPTTEQHQHQQHQHQQPSSSCLHGQTYGHGHISKSSLHGWVEGSDGEWEWEEDDPTYVAPTITIDNDGGDASSASSSSSSSFSGTSAEATPTLPSGKFRPKQSLGQNFLRDGNTVAKIIKTFHEDATRDRPSVDRIVELGPGAGALTDQLVKKYGTEVLQCIEIDDRSVELLGEKHPGLLVHHDDVLQVNYPEMAKQEGQPLVVIGNLPYYITSQILFALADASHYGSVDSATVTMQWEVAQRMVAPTKCKVSPLHGRTMEAVTRTIEAVQSIVES